MTEKLPTINLKGKEYVQVKDRLAYFNDHYPNGQITTEVINNNANMVMFKATIKPDISQERTFTAHSFGTVDELKAFEKLETVSIGRCLALMGIGILESVASADEMNRFNAKQEPKPVAQLKTASKVKASDIKLEKGDSLATGTRKTGKDIGKPWYALDKANGNRIWLTQDQYEYLGCYTTSANLAPPPTKAPLPSEAPPTPDEIINDLPF